MLEESKQAPQYEKLYQQQLEENKALKEKVDQWIANTTMLQNKALLTNESYVQNSPSISFIDNSFHR